MEEIDAMMRAFVTRNNATLAAQQLGELNLSLCLA